MTTSKPDELAEAKRIAERMLKMPPDPRKGQDAPKGEKAKATKPAKKSSRKDR